MKKLLIIVFAGLGLISCEKQDDPRDPVPKLELISIGPPQVKEFMDSVLIVLEYEDGDGDLGGIHPDSSNLFVVDKRIDVAFKFRIQELVPGSEEVPVKGRLNIVLQNLFITGGAQQEKVSFDIYAYDRAGNRSNSISTPEILLISN